MTTQLTVLLTTAVSLAFVHTVLGPDHYLPFVMMSAAGKWSATKTLVVTILCGLGHILSSVVLGFIGIALGLAVRKLVVFESARGELAAWLLIAFGFVYCSWGVRRAIRNKPHRHLHQHDDDQHDHSHSHLREHTHCHTQSGSSMTPWILFTVFVFGPCEPLIPLLMYPAARSSTISIVLVAGVFGITTILTMLSIVMLSFLGFARLPLARLERYSHALAGLAIFLCGGAIKFLGL